MFRQDSYTYSYFKNHGSVNVMSPGRSFPLQDHSPLNRGRKCEFWVALMGNILLPKSFKTQVFDRSWIQMVFFKGRFPKADVYFCRSVFFGAKSSMEQFSTARWSDFPLGLYHQTFPFFFKVFLFGNVRRPLGSTKSVNWKCGDYTTQLYGDIISHSNDPYQMDFMECHQVGCFNTMLPNHYHGKMVVSPFPFT